MPLAIHAFSRPLSQKETVPRDKMIKSSKAKSEEALEDIKVLLGWLYNTHTLCVSLPEPNLIIDNEHILYSQWFPGLANVIPDILSRDWHLDDGKILNLLTHIFPTQMHPNFLLSQVSSVINPFLCSVLQSLPKPTQIWTKPNSSRFVLGINGISSCNQSALKAMSFWLDSSVDKDNSYWLPSKKLSDKPGFCRYQRRYWLQ